MSSEPLDPEIKSLVRRYSEKASQEMPQETLTQSLVAWETEETRRDNETASWQRWLLQVEVDFYKDEEAAQIEKECNKVKEKWKKFKSHFPEAGADATSGLPTVATLVGEVTRAQRAWESKREKGFGAFKKNILAFAESLDGHKALFSIFPSGDKYTSLITGVVSSVVKASVSYNQAAEGFSQALADMSYDLRYVRKNAAIAATPDMRRLVASLYAHVFDFLCNSMEWLTKPHKRFISAFDSRFHGKAIGDKVKIIQRLVQQVTREAQLESQVRVKNTGEELRVLKDYLQKVGEDVRHGDQGLEEKLDLVLLLLGQQTSSFLGSTAPRILQENARQLASQNEIPSSLQTSEQDSDMARLRAMTPPVPTQQTRQEVESYTEDTRHVVQDIMADLEQFNPGLAYERPGLPGGLVQCVQKWIQATETRLLWVEGPALGSLETKLSQMAQQIYAASLQAGIPAVLFSHRREYAFQGDGVPIQEAGCVAMLYSVIQQLVHLLPVRFESTPALCGDRFAQLDGTMDSIGAALDIFGALLSLAPPVVVFVFNGVEMLASSEPGEGTDPTVARMINHLRDNGKSRLLKVLFTTGGNSYVLGEKLDVAERARTSQRGLSRGHTHLNYISFEGVS